MTSQIESIRSPQYTPLYENEQLESRISQWGLLFIGCKTINSHKTLLTFFNKKLNTMQHKFGAQKGCVLGVQVYAPLKSIKMMALEKVVLL